MIHSPQTMQEGVRSILVVLQTATSAEDYTDMGNFMLGQHQLLLKRPFPLLAAVLGAFPHLSVQLTCISHCFTPVAGFEVTILESYFS